MLLGVGGEVEQKGNTQGVPAMYSDINPFVTAATADVSVEFSGASIFIYGVWRVIDPTVSGFNNANQFGFVLQCGVFISDTVELTARLMSAERRKC